MSEKIYTLLLRLYPARFRACYGEESLQLFRDRLRDEAGFYARLRLWLDLLTDTVIALPRSHRMGQPATGVATSPGLADGLPSFEVLDRAPLRPAAIVAAWLLSLAGAGAFFILLSYAGIRPGSPLATSQERTQSQSPSRSSSATSPSAAPSASPTSAPALTRAASTASASVANTPPNTLPQNLPAAPPASVQSPPTPPVDPAEWHRVVLGAAQNLRDHYFDRSLAQQAAAALLAQEKLGADNAAPPGDLAMLLTGQIRKATDDRHLVVVYSATPLPSVAAAPSSTIPAAYRQAMLRQNCTIEKLATLPHHIGYLKINSFPDPSICRQQIDTALISLNSADAIVFDLRNNSGGYPDMVANVAARLFDRPVPWYNPRATTSDPSWTASPVPGSGLASKPVYILTSSITLSGAEQFTYNLKMLKRATVIGEATGGSAHIGIFHRIDAHYGIGIPETRVINPYSDYDWEGVGVEPDVKVKAADALATAENLAEQRLQPNRTPR